MLPDIGRAALLIILAPLIVAMLRVVVDLIMHGEAKIRHVREEGGGVGQKFAGELTGGQRKASAARGHGAHFRITRSGHLAVMPKSVVTPTPR